MSDIKVPANRKLVQVLDNTGATGEFAIQCSIDKLPADEYLVADRVGYRVLNPVDIPGTRFVKGWYEVTAKEDGSGYEWKKVEEGGSSDLPDHTVDDAGKVLAVQDDNTLGWKEVSGSDNVIEQVDTFDDSSIEPSSTTVDSLVYLKKDILGPVTEYKGYYKGNNSTDPTTLTKRSAGFVGWWRKDSSFSFNIVFRVSDGKITEEVIDECKSRIGEVTTSFSGTTGVQIFGLNDSFEYMGKQIPASEYGVTIIFTDKTCKTISSVTANTSNKRSEIYAYLKGTSSTTPEIHYWNFAGTDPDVAVTFDDIPSDIGVKDIKLDDAIVGDPTIKGFYTVGNVGTESTPEYDWVEKKFYPTPVLQSVWDTWTPEQKAAGWFIVVEG